MNVSGKDVVYVKHVTTEAANKFRQLEVTIVDEEEPEGRSETDIRLRAQFVYG
jgi:hypothetical protein